MNELNKFSTILIEVKYIIHKIKNNLENISIYDLQSFYELSKINFFLFEKSYRDFILNHKNDNDKLIIKLIKNDIEVYQEFHNNYQNSLKKINLNTIIENSLTFEKREKNIAYDEVRTASKKLDEIINKIDSSAYSNLFNDQELMILRRKEKNAKKEWKEYQQIYYEKFNFFTLKHQEYSTYKRFNFEKTHYELSKIYKFIESLNSSNDTFNENNIFDAERIGIICRFVLPFLDPKIDEKEFIDRLKLINIKQKKIHKSKYIGKILFVISEVLKTVSTTKEKKEDWAKSFTYSSKLNYSTFKNGSKANNESNLISEVNNALKHLKK